MAKNWMEQRKKKLQVKFLLWKENLIGVEMLMRDVWEPETFKFCWCWSVTFFPTAWNTVKNKFKKMFTIHLISTVELL